MITQPTILGAVQALSRCRDYPAILAVVRAHARRLIGADGVTFVLIDDGECHYIEEDAISPLWKGQRFPADGCITGWVAKHRTPAVIEDVFADPRIPYNLYRPTFVKSLAVVPVRSEDPIGAIGAYWAAHHPATPEDLSVMQALADSASVAWANAGLIAELRSARDTAEDQATENARLLSELTEQFDRRGKAEQELRRSETRFRTLVETLPDAVFINVGGRVAFCNPACVRLFGAAGPDQLLGKTPFDLHPPRWHEVIRGRIEDIRETGNAVPEIEEEIQRIDDKRLVPVRATALPVTDGDSTEAVLVVLHDLTEEKRVEAQVRQQGMLLREAAEMAHVGGWDFDPVTLEADWTAETARIHDLEPPLDADVPMGLSFTDPEDRPRLESALKEAIERGAPYDLELRMTSATGTRKWVRTICRPVVEGGKVLRVRGSLQDITERKRGEEAVARLAAIVESSEDAIISKSLAGIIRSWNAGAERLFGYRAEEVIGRPITLIIPPDRLDEEPEILVLLNRGQRSDHFETVRLRKDGTRVNVSLSISPVKDGQGRVVGGAKIARDISKRKMAEEALRESEERFRQVAENIREVFWLTNQATREILYVNPAYETVWGRACQSLYEAPEAWLDAIHADDRERVHLAWEANAAKGRLDEVYRVIRSDGSVRWVHDRGFPVRNAAGEVYRMAGVAEDITLRHEAEEALRLRDRAIQSLTEGILITDPNRPGNPIIFASPNFERLTGYSAVEVLGRNCRFLQGVHTDEDAITTVRQAVRERRPCSVEILNYKKDGTPFWNALSVSPVCDGAGRPTHFIGIQTDVTDRRRREEMYRQTQKMEVIGRLASGIIHDFNNLLCVIGGYGDLVLNSLPSSGPARDWTLQMKEAGERATQVARRLLDFCRGDSAKMQVLDLERLLANLASLLRRVLGEDIVLTVTCQPDIGKVRANSAQLEQVLLNLVVNARDAMPAGGRLAIRATNVDLPEAEGRGGPHVLVEVDDTGCGMTKEMLAKIFEPFFTSKEPGKGSGLGLAIVADIVGQSGGHVEVVSEVGRGTTFEVYLPRVEGPPEPSTPASASDLVLPGSETVLLVEDDVAVRGLTGFVLATAGYTVLLACDGVEALEVASAHEGTIDLLLSDVVMPRLGGRELAARLLPRRPEMKVLFISGYFDDEAMRSLITRGEADLLEKPFSHASLTHKMREMLDQPGK